jgi:hypothetical protein
MQGAAEFHHQIADALFPQVDAVFDNAAILILTLPWIRDC